jgi:hypothetical protein
MLNKPVAVKGLLIPVGAAHGIWGDPLKPPGNFERTCRL